MTSTEIIEAVRVSRFFAAPRDKVFRAWIVAEEFKDWWKPGNYHTSDVELDARVGGKYRVTMKAPDGKVQFLFGSYLEISPPERLVMTWALQGSPSDDGYEAILTIDFITKGEGTEILLLHENLQKTSLRNFEAGWQTLLDQFAHYLDRGK